MWRGGSTPSGNQLDLDYDAEESIELYVVYPIRCMEDSFNTAKLPEQYRRKYWSGWDWSDIGEKDIAKKSNTGLFLICGAVKFGSGSAYGRMTTPALGQYGLSGVSDIVVSFKACPYTEPNLTTGNLMVSPYILCGATFNISIWAGAGTFENGSTEMTLTNLTPIRPMPRATDIIRGRSIRCGSRVPIRIPASPSRPLRRKATIACGSMI